jgi:G-patch domain
LSRVIKTNKTNKLPDASRFGQTYLAKFGWDASKGLGASGEGRTSALKATQKLDMLGIGVQHQKDPNGIAWRQNRDFENLLRRLNHEVTAEVEVEVEVSGMGLFHKAREGGGEVEEVVGVAEAAVVDDANGQGATKERKEKKKKKKRKAVEGEAEDVVEKEGLDDEKQRKKRRKSRPTSPDEVAPIVAIMPPNVTPQEAVAPVRAPYVRQNKSIDPPPLFFFDDRLMNTHTPGLLVHARIALE